MNTSIKKKLFILVLLSISVLAVTLGIQSWRNYKVFERETYVQLEYIVQSTLSVMDGQNERVSSGELTRSEAKAETMDYFRNIKFGDGLYVFVLDSKYYSIMNPMAPSFEGKYIGDFKDPKGIFVAREWVETGVSGGGIVNYTATDTVNDTTYPKVAFVGYFEEWDVVIGAPLRVDHLMDALFDEIITNTIFLIVTAAIFLGVALAISRSITKPLFALGKSMQDLNDGDTAQTILGQERGDEIGPMARTVEAFRLGLIERERLEEEKQAAVKIDKEHQAYMKEIVAEFQHDAEDILSSLQKDIDVLRLSSSELSQSSLDTSAQSTQAQKTSHNISENVQSVAGAAEELSATVSEVQHNAVENMKVVEDATKYASIAYEKVKELEKTVGNIEAVIKLIAEIAEQTNLLALNATIEAARAGDAGKGFAVVAGEVKQLAEQTSKATSEITNQISNIQGATQETVVSIEQISKTTEGVFTSMSSITGAMNEQLGAINEISRNVHEAADGSLQLAQSNKSVSEMAGSTQTCAKNVEGAAASLGESSGTIEKSVREFLSRVTA